MTTARITRDDRGRPTNASDQRGGGPPIEPPAQGAGADKDPLSRRYGSKTELLQRLCVMAMEQALEAADDALKTEDPWTGLSGQADIAAHAVEHDVHAADRIADPRGPVAVAVADRDVGPEVAGEPKLALLAGQRDDPGPGVAGELD